MQGLKITLRHGYVFETECSAIFMKHIEGIMSGPERDLNAAVQGRLQALHADNEKEDHSILVAEGVNAGAKLQGLLACPFVYVVNFHEQDLPFSYHSVDHYARSIVRVAASGNSAALLNR